jgi:hypothetical protein
MTPFHEAVGGGNAPENVRGSWQGRKDSNPRPSVLETDALTRLSYAPKAEGKVSIVR